MRALTDEQTILDTREARRYLRGVTDADLQAFAERQIRSRRRLAMLLKFYSAHDCRMARLHLLAACAVALGRFAGLSKTFDEMGAYFMPLDESGAARTNEWLEFIQACEQKLPLEVREEKWLAAHFADLQTVRDNGLYQKFEDESAQRKQDATWQLLQQHLDVSLGVRMMDKFAIAGMMPYETVIADSLALTTRKLFTAGSRLLARYAAEAARAVVSFEKQKDLPTYRRTALLMTKYTVASLAAAKIFRQGVRARERGRIASETENWNLLPATLGERISEIHPTIIEFYQNPAKFDVTASLKLETAPMRFWSWALTLLFGQGLYEADLNEIKARFRVFSRRDRSMHFVRELYCRDRLRVFDSDFVVRGGKLFEIFTDLKIAIEMLVKPIENGGLSISGTKLFWHNRKMPLVGLHVEFQSRVEKDETGAELLKVNGVLQMQPRTKFGRFVAFIVLRRPKILGSIHYVAQRKTA